MFPDILPTAAKEKQGQQRECSLPAAERLILRQPIIVCPFKLLLRLVAWERHQHLARVVLGRAVLVGQTGIGAREAAVLVLVPVRAHGLQSQLREGFRHPINVRAVDLLLRSQCFLVTAEKVLDVQNGILAADQQPGVITDTAAHLEDVRMRQKLRHFRVKCRRWVVELSHIVDKNQGPYHSQGYKAPGA